MAESLNNIDSSPIGGINSQDNLGVNTTLTDNIDITNGRVLDKEGFVFSPMPSAGISPSISAIDYGSVNYPDIDAKIEASSQQVVQMSENIKNSLRLKQSGLSSNNDIFTTPAKRAAQILSPLKVKDLSARPLNVNPRESHGMLSDGTMVPRFDEFSVGLDNEDIAAQSQFTGSIWWNGIRKMGIKTLTSVAGALGNIIYGPVKAIQEGNWEAIMNNDFTQFLDDINTRVDYELPNYVSKEERDYNFFQSLTTANFWANDVLGAVSFTLGAMASEGLIALATGGVSIPFSVARTGLRAASVANRYARAGKGISYANRFARSYASKAKKDINRYLRTTTAARKTLDVANTIRFMGTSSSWEATVESSGFRKEAFQNFFNTHREIYGRTPNYDELKAFGEEVQSAQNSIFAANMGILGVSNLALFGKTFGVGASFGKNVSKATNRLFGLGVVDGVSDTGKQIYKVIPRQASRAQRIAGTTYYSTRKLFTEGIWEEGGQGLATSTADAYIDSRFNALALDKNLTFIDSLKEGFREQFGTKEGWKAIGIGFIIGGMFSSNLRSGRNFSIGETRKYSIERRNWKEFADSYNQNSEKIRGIIEKNPGINLDWALSTLEATYDPAFERFGHSADSALASVVDVTGMLANADAAEANAGKNNYSASLRDWEMAMFSKMQMDEMRGSLDYSTDNFNLIIDSFSDADIANIYGVEESQAGAVRESLKRDYTRSIQMYRNASQLADNIIGDNPNDPLRNIASLNFFLGQKAADSIDGMFESLGNLLNNNEVQRSGMTLLGISKKDYENANRIREIDSRTTEITNRIGELNRNPGSYDQNSAIRKEIDELNVEMIGLISERESLDNSLSLLKRGSIVDLYREVEEVLINNERPTSQDVVDAINIMERIDAIAEGLKESDPGLYTDISYLSNNIKDQIVMLNSFEQAISDISNPRFQSSWRDRILNRISGIYNKYDSLDDSISQKVRTGPNGEAMNIIREAGLFRNEVDLEAEFSEGRISEDELFTFKAYNRMLDAYNHGLLFTDGNILIDFISDILIDKLKNGEQLTPEEDVEWNRVVDDIALKVKRGVPLSEKETVFYDLTKRFVDATAADLKIKQGNTLKDKLDELRRKADLLTSPNNIQEYVEGRRAAFVRESKESSERGEINNPITNGEIDVFLELYFKENKTDEEVDTFIEFNERLSQEVRDMGYDGLLEEMIMLRQSQLSESSNLSNVQTSFPIEDMVFEPSPIESPNTRGNWSNMQNVGHAFARYADDGRCIISNISLLSLIDSMDGASYNMEGDAAIVLLRDGSMIRIKIEPNNGHLSLSRGDVQLFNRSSGLIIKNVDNVFTYSVGVFKITDGVARPLETDSGYGQNGEVHVDTHELASLRENDEIFFEVDPNDKLNTELLSRYKQAKDAYDKNKNKENAKVLSEAESNLTNNLVLYAKKDGGNGGLVSVPKATSGESKSIGQEYIALFNIRKRASFLLKQATSSSRLVVTNQDGGILKVSISEVLPGRPNMDIGVSYDNAGNPILSVSNREFSGNENIEGIGYISPDGEVVVRYKGDSLKPNINTDFVAKIAQRNRRSLVGKKIPIVIIPHPNGNYYAYPVSLKEGNNTDVESLISNLQSILDSRIELSNEEKTDVIANAIAVGISPKDFILSYNNPSIDLQDAQIRTIISKLEDLRTIPNLDVWVNSTIDIMDILRDHALINIDLNGDAFYSMKVKLDLLPFVLPIENNPQRELTFGRRRENESASLPGNIITRRGVFVEESQSIEELENIGSDIGEWANYVAENSNDVNEVLSVYNEIDSIDVSQDILPWQEQLVGRRIHPSSFDRYIDPNLRMGEDNSSNYSAWLLPESADMTGNTIDDLTHELGVSAMDIVNFIRDNPSNRYKGIYDSQKSALSLKFSELASRIAGRHIGGINSNTGRSFISGMNSIRRANLGPQEFQNQSVGSISLSDIGELGIEGNVPLSDRIVQSNTIEGYERVFEEAMSLEESLDNDPIREDILNQKFFKDDLYRRIRGRVKSDFGRSFERWVEKDKVRNMFLEDSSTLSDSSMEQFAKRLSEKHNQEVSVDQILDVILDFPLRTIPAYANEYTVRINRGFSNLASELSDNYINGVDSASGVSFISGREYANDNPNYDYYSRTLAGMAYLYEDVQMGDNAPSMIDEQLFSKVREEQNAGC